MMTVSDRETTSGVAYGDADLVRLYLELAMAEHNGNSRSVRVMLEQGARSHELRRPQPPAPVGPAPVFGRRGRRNKAPSAALVTEQRETVAPTGTPASRAGRGRRGAGRGCPAGSARRREGHPGAGALLGAQS